DAELAPRNSRHSEHRSLVDRVAREMVELDRKEIARRARFAPRRGNVFAAEPDRELPRRFDRANGAPELCREPAAQERRLRARAADADLLLADPGPVAGELDPPVVDARPGDVRDGGPLESLRQLAVAQVVPFR